MVKALLDTSIVVDLLRGYPPALTWFAKQNDLGVCQAVWLEIIEGAPNRRSQKQALDLLQQFEMIAITTPDVQWAIETLIRFNLSHNIDAFDCLIGATSHRLQMPIYTRNLKHFTPIIGSLAELPY